MFLAVMLACGCDRTPAPASEVVGTSAPRVASLSPAATDIVVAMQLAGQLIAVSNFEPPRKITDHLPRAGDYRSVDWELLAVLKPDVIVTQYHADKMPEGFADRAAALNIKMFNRKIDSLKDTRLAIAELGTVLDAKSEADLTVNRWDDALSQVRTLWESYPKRGVLLVVGESGLNAVGPGTFLGELLEIAGGVNVIPVGVDYPTLDRERLAALDPDVIIQLLPGASTQSIEYAKSFWPTMSELRAVKQSQVFWVTDPDVLLPGFCATQTAERLAAILHGSHPTTRPN